MSESTNPIDCLYEDEPRMDAYYYEFTPTGNRHIDAILSAVAWAGKGAHHTQYWEGKEGTYGPLAEGQSFIDVIQEAANRAAAHDREVAATALEELSALVARKGAEWDRQSGEHAAGMSHAASKVCVYISEQIAAQKRGV